MQKPLDNDLINVLAKFGDTPETRLGEAFDRYGIKQIEDNCWIWQNSLDGSGYGQLSVNGRLWRAHRLFFFLAYEQDPSGLVVMHKCDTPRCVQPSHLKIGTQLDNIRDRHRKGRNGACRGDDAPWSKLTSEKARELRKRFAAGESRMVLMNEFGISKSQLYRVAKRKSWRSI